MFVFPPRVVPELQTWSMHNFTSTYDMNAPESSDSRFFSKQKRQQQDLSMTDSLGSKPQVHSSTNHFPNSPCDAGPSSSHGLGVKKDPRGRKRKYHTLDEKKAARIKQNRESMRKSREKSREKERETNAELEHLRNRTKVLEQQRSQMMDFMEQLKLFTRAELNQRWPEPKSGQAEKITIQSILND